MTNKIKGSIATQDVFKAFIRGNIDAKKSINIKDIAGAISKNNLVFNKKYYFIREGEQIFLNKKPKLCLDENSKYYEYRNSKQRYKIFEKELMEVKEDYVSIPKNVRTKIHKAFAFINRKLALMVADSSYANLKKHYFIYQPEENHYTINEEKFYLWLRKLFQKNKLGKTDMLTWLQKVLLQSESIENISKGSFFVNAKHKNQITGINEEVVALVVIPPKLVLAEVFIDGEEVLLNQSSKDTYIKFFEYFASIDDQGHKYNSNNKEGN